MSLTSWSFGFYLLITVPVYWLLPERWRRHFLLTASLVLLGLASGKVLFLLLLLSIFTYWLGGLISGRSGKRTLFVCGLLVPVAVLAYYKYTPMLISGLQFAGRWFHHPFTLSVPKIIVPIGISFFTFKLVHYLIICHKGEAASGGFRQFLLYMAFFPIFTSGPIERWPHFTAQNPAYSSSHIYTGAARILVGLLKKKVLADNLIIFANMLQADNVTGWGYWIAAYAYAFRIYFDFSGYSDIAIGSARLFGYEIMENFNWPYLQRNLSLFWKNWHMTLTGWFIEYVFIPLGGSRGSFPRTVFNTLVVMGITGLWHGAAWHFLTWGLYHGCGLVVWRLWGLLAAAKINRLWPESQLVRAAGTLITFHFVTVGWVFFAAGFRQSLHVVAKMLFLS